MPGIPELPELRIRAPPVRHSERSEESLWLPGRRGIRKDSRQAPHPRLFTPSRQREERLCRRKVRMFVQNRDVRFSNRSGYREEQRTELSAQVRGRLKELCGKSDFCRAGVQAEAHAHADQSYAEQAKRGRFRDRYGRGDWRSSRPKRIFRYGTRRKESIFGIRAPKRPGRKHSRDGMTDLHS